MSVDTRFSRSPRSAPRSGTDPDNQRLVARIAAELHAIGRSPARGPARKSGGDAGAPVADARAESPERARAESIAGLLEQAHRVTGMEVALLGEIRDGQEVLAALAGDACSFGLTPGGSVPLEESYCQFLLQGRLRNIVRDARSDELVRDLGLTRAAHIGAYIGVPLTTRDAQLFVLCCLAHEQRPDLSDRHVHALHRLAQNIGRQLSAGSGPASPRRDGR